MQKPLSAFRVNQTGYAAGLPVTVAFVTDEPVVLKNAEGHILRSFESRTVPADEASGDPVSLMDLGVLPEGVYALQCKTESRTFTVRPQSWQPVTDALVKGLYYQRCGCELRPEHAGVYTHPACHTAPAAEWENRGFVKRVPGGWHDAGDYGKYTGPGAVTVAHLIYAWKLFPAGCSGDLNIPETGSGIPDILSEALYELKWLLEMQRSDGAFWHKLTKDHFAPFIMPQEDTDPEYLMPVSHCATAAACACLALAARVYRPFEAALADRMLQAALAAWNWLQANPEFVPFRNPDGVRTGWYGDRTDRDERFWAACELLAATGDAAFRSAAESLFAEGLLLTEYGWANVAGLGAVCCLFDLKEKAGDILFADLKETFLKQSESALALSHASGYGTSLAPERYSWGSILPIMSNAVSMILNAELTGREDMRSAALLQWHYALGMNALDLCFVTGFGERSVMHPHHRPSGADGIDAPVPGLISGGPNKGLPYPDTREKVGENTPPAKCFLDETPSADTNEIAIYWNSPAVLAGAYFCALAQGR